ncbi:hypothetical protein FV139_20370 [Parahaliea maris]|uniref:Uncharacterized protein n=1 Tax=Parahaliea maris TaxID=2716870 RepID=A0A5C8ZLE9_9GAMM|nr:hypothetical protein [Parahaliea maris]TXS89293.1 hypothetical protein FV139_20370 [Parahaliea maris]
MSDEPKVSYSFQMNTGAPQSRTEGAPAQPVRQEADQMLYAVDDFESLSVAGGTLLVGKHTGAQLLSQPQVAMVLQHCLEFRTLGEHAQRLTALFPQLGGNVNDALRVLGLVKDSGLMISAGSICERVNQSVSTNAVDRTKSFIITCDRPAAVARLLESLLHNGKLAQQKQLYLIDDSRQAENARHNREAVEQFNLVSPSTLAYIGPEEQADLITKLCAALPEDEPAVRFLFSREEWGGQKTYGRSRNLCLLLSVGERAVILDDDVLAMAVARPGTENAPVVADGMRSAEFYQDMTGWQRQWQPLDFDPLAGHGRCLGQSLAQALAEFGSEGLQPGQLAGASLSLFRDLHAESSVLVTQSGAVGDPGTTNNAWLPNLGSDNVRSMLASEGGLHTALTTRQCWVGQPRNTVTKRAVMSQVTGLDNRAELPPYFPALRGEDQLFGIMLDFLIPDSVVLEYAWSVPHLPVENRAGNPQGDSVVPKGGLQLLGSWLGEFKPFDASVDYDTRMDLLAARLDTLAQLSPSGLVARYRALLTRAQGFALQTLNDRLADTGTLDANWKGYLENNARACVAALQQPAALADIPDVPDDVDESAIVQVIQTRAAGFATALRAWRRIREVAPTL